MFAVNFSEVGFIRLFLKNLVIFRVLRYETAVRLFFCLTMIKYCLKFEFFILFSLIFLFIKEDTAQYF